MGVITADLFVAEVRAQADEANTTTRSDEDILKMADRGIRHMNMLLAVHHRDPLYASAQLDLEDGERSYDLPSDIFEDRVMNILINTTGAPIPTQRRTPADLARLAVSGTTANPFSWEVRQRSIYFQQTPNGSNSAEVIYLKALENLVLPQGRITALAGDGSYVIVDEAGEDLTTSGDQLGSYFNIVSWRDGTVKGTFQIQALANNKLTLRPTPVRDSVQGRTVSGSIDADMEIEVDDYVCAHSGTCVPQLQGSLYNFLVEFTVTCTSRSLNGVDPAVQLQKRILDEYEERVEEQGLARPQKDRVQNASGVWPRMSRRWPFSRS